MLVVQGIVTYLFNYVLYFLASAFMIIIAVLFGFRFFTQNNFGALRLSCNC